MVNFNILLVNSDGKREFIHPKMSPDLDQLVQIDIFKIGRIEDQSTFVAAYPDQGSF